MNFVDSLPIRIFWAGVTGSGMKSLPGTWLRQALDGNIAEALKGSAEVFYFMPGMRYYLALGKPFWGDSGFAYLFPLLLLPIGLYFFARILWPALASLLLVACFLLVKLRPLEEVAWQLSSYSELALLGFAEPMGYFLFFVGAALRLYEHSKRFGGVIFVACRPWFLRLCRGSHLASESSRAGHVSTVLRGLSLHQGAEVQRSCGPGVRILTSTSDAVAQPLLRRGTGLVDQCDVPSH